MGILAWDKMVRARKLDADKGQIIGEFKIRDIIKESNRYQIEAIISATCAVMNQLIEFEEARLVKSLGEKNGTSKPV